MHRWSLIFLVTSTLSAEHYTFGLLRNGLNRDPLPKEEGERLQAAHMANINRLADQGDLVGAGPAIESKTLRGVFLFKTSMDRARELSNQDPMVQANRLALELLDWDGPAGVSEDYKAERKADPNYQFRMIRRQLCLIPAGTDFSAARAAVPKDKVVAAGPITGQKYSGLLVLNLESVDAARALLPNAEIHQWMFADGTFPKAK
jgi:uncharacterized protein YciI